LAKRSAERAVETIDKGLTQCRTYGKKKVAFETDKKRKRASDGTQKEGLKR